MNAHEAISVLIDDVCNTISTFHKETADQETIDYFDKLREAVKVTDKYLGESNDVHGKRKSTTSFVNAYQNTPRVF